MNLRKRDRELLARLVLCVLSVGWMVWLSQISWQHRWWFVLGLQVLSIALSVGAAQSGIRLWFRRRELERWDGWRGWQ